MYLVYTTCSISPFVKQCKLLHTVYKDGQKSPAQKEREAHLLKELLELIDERDKLERTKMTTEMK